jgi:ubiquinone/menaquinone biosynthesis C-methylase UbiE
VSDEEMLGYYGRRAPEYERIYAKPERQADLERVRTWLRSELAGHRILEIACGTGYWTEWLAPVAEAITATDASADVLAVARGKTYPPGRVAFAEADAFALDGVPGSFSAAFAGFWWSHVPRERVREFLAGLHRRIAPGARVVLLDNRYVEGSSTPIARRDGGGNTYQVRALDDGTTHEVLKNFPTPAELEAVLAPASADLRVTEFEYYWGATYTVRAA